MTVRVQTPVVGYTGTVGSVAFVDGEGETDDATMLSYFARHGYLLGEVEREPEAVEEDEPESDEDELEIEDADGSPAGNPDLDEFEDDDQVEGETDDAESDEGDDDSDELDELDD